MKKLGPILGALFLVLIVGFVLFRIFFNVVQNLRLVTGGMVTQGMIINSGFCGKQRSYSEAVQFTDTKGRQQEAAVADACGNISIPFNHEGEQVSVVYLPDDPTIARIQGDLVLQFWVLEVPFLLLMLLIVLITLRMLMRPYIKS